MIFKTSPKCNIYALSIPQTCIVRMSKPRGKLAQLVPRAASRHTWKTEFEWYRRNFHGFLHTSLVGPIVVIFLTAPYVVPKQNTILMAIVWGIIGGFSITIGEWGHST